MNAVKGQMYASIMRVLGKDRRNVNKYNQLSEC